MENATYLCSIHTHSIISKVYFYSKTNLLLAIASKLGENKILAFKLFLNSQNKILEHVTDNQLLQKKKLTKKKETVSN